MALAVDFDALNIFFVHINPTIAAQSLPDAHVRKMVVESTQLLANAYHLERATTPAPLKSDGEMYRPAFLSHPAADWAVEDFKQWDWLRMHAHGLANEFLYRWGKEHGCLPALKYMGAHLPLAWMKNREFYAPPLLMPDEFKSRIKGAIWSYRNYIRLGKKHLHTWTKRLPPLWLVDQKIASVVVQKLVDDSVLEIANADEIAGVLKLPPAKWKKALKTATDELNGLDSEDVDEVVEDIIDKALVTIVAPEQYRPAGLSPAEWQIILHIATEKVNGSDPITDGDDWDYTRGG